MSSKTCLILFGLLVAFAVLSAAENNEENSLSVEAPSSRLARSADARRKNNHKSKKSKKTKSGKKKAKNAAKKSANKTKKAAKKSAKKAKKAAQKASKKAEKKAKKENKSKNENKSRKNKSSKRMTARTVNGKCLESAAVAMNRWRGVVANFNKQKTRIEKQAEIAGKKGGKKSVFGHIALKLVDLGGGNKSALSCSGSTTSSGAKQLTNLTNTLLACEVSVNIEDYLRRCIKELAKETIINQIII